MVLQYMFRSKTIKDQQNENIMLWTHAGIKGVQLSGLVTPPLWLLSKLFKKAPGYSRIVPWTTLATILVAEGILYANVEHGKITQ